MPLPSRTIFLVGFMASGKSTVGRALAGRLGWSFLDTDEEIEGAEGRSIEAIFADSGEGYFRRVEWEVLERIGGGERRVVATGGGAFLGATQRRFMRRQGWTVWLDVPLERCAVRAAGGPGRPLWPADPVARRALYEKRRAVYALAETRVEVGSASAEGVVDLILAGG